MELDDICGRLIDALERTGQLESTLVVISSDNGPEMETWPDSAFTPFRCAKGSTWEGGVRVPAVVSWPGMVEPGRVSDGIVHLLDLFATCTTLAGCGDQSRAQIKLRLFTIEAGQRWNQRRRNDQDRVGVTQRVADQKAWPVLGVVR